MSNSYLDQTKPYDKSARSITAKISARQGGIVEPPRTETTNGTPSSTFFRTDSQPDTQSDLDKLREELFSETLEDPGADQRAQIEEDQQPQIENPDRYVGDGTPITSYTILDNVAAQLDGLSLEATGLYYKLHSMCKWPNNVCWPSLIFLANHFATSKSKIVNARNELVETKLIDYVPGRGRRANSYTMRLRPSVVELVKMNRADTIKKQLEKKKAAAR